jgi:hypothetical protein
MTPLRLSRQKHGRLLKLISVSARSSSELFIFLYLHALIVRVVDGGSFEVGAHQDCELQALATVDRS